MERNSITNYWGKKRKRIFLVNQLPYVATRFQYLGKQIFIVQTNFNEKIHDCKLFKKQEKVIKLSFSFQICFISEIQISSFQWRKNISSVIFRIEVRSIKGKTTHSMLLLLLISKNTVQKWAIFLFIYFKNDRKICNKKMGQCR